MIDPTLAVASSESNTVWTSSYWPSYANCSVGERRLFLRWLTNGRKDPDAPIGLVFLYFYGLERRLLDDARSLEDARAEVPRLVAEIDRLRRIYPNASFQQYSGCLRDLAIAMYGDTTRFRTHVECQPGSPSAGTLVALGRRIQESRPLTPELAYAWSRSLESAPKPWGLRQIADDLSALFEQRYRERFGEGLRVTQPKRNLKLDYRGASSNRVGMRLEFDVPDVRTVSAAQRPLGALLQECVDDLQPLIRARRRDPTDALEIAAAVPAELKSSSALDGLVLLKEYAEGVLHEKVLSIGDTRELLRTASVEWNETIRKRDCIVIATALERIGVGMEPDVRWLGPKLNRNEKVVLFRRAAGVARSPTADYRVAQLFLNMAVAVALSDGTIDDVELDQARRQIDSFVKLDAPERERLGAHLMWLTTARPSVGKLLPQLKAMPAEQRAILGEAAVRTAAADGRVDPAEMRMLEKIYRALSLDESTISADLHRVLTTGVPVAGQSTTSSGLNAAAIARKIEETADVQKLLTSIFTDDESGAAVETSGASPVAMACTGAAEVTSAKANEGDMGLDDAHAALLLRILNDASDVIARSAVDAWCRDLGLMPDGALESVNESAYSFAGDALFDADEDIVIHSDVRQQLKNILQGISA